MKKFDEELHQELKYGHPVRYIQCQCSTAHTFGNVTAFIQNWLLNLFPEGLFKTIHVNSKIAHQQLRSTPKEFLKKSPPMFIIRPRIEWTDNSKFLNGTPTIERMGDLYHTYGGTNLQPFFHDDRHKVAIKYQLNRHVMNFDVILIFNTLMQQINWGNYLMNAVRYEIPFDLETCLESYIAPDLLKELANCAGVPMFDEEGSTKDFLKYLNSNSMQPVTYKLQGSSGTDEYYRYYPVKIYTTLSNFNADDGDKVGHVANRYQISFSVRCEFFSTGFYYLFSDNLKRENMIMVHNDDSTIIPMFTDVLTYEDVDLPLGWNLYASPSCRLETPDDELDISSVLNNSLKTAIKFHLDRGIPLTQFFKLRLRKQGKLMEYGKEYTFDPETYNIKFIHCNTYYTYKILIMINVEYINELVKDIYKLK